MGSEMCIRDRLPDHGRFLAKPPWRTQIKHLLAGVGIILVCLGCGETPPGGNPPATTVINPPGPRPTTSVESARPIPPRHAGTAKILWATPPIDSEKLRQAIDRATSYLVKHCRPNGKFEYVVHPDPSVNLAPSYNIPVSYTHLTLPTKA